MRARPADERFAEKYVIDPETGCWVWMGVRDSKGYGKLSVGKAMVRVHRWSYEHHVSPIPDGLQIDHLCRNRSCVNPEHLEPVTPRENTMRGEGPAAIHAAKTHCPQGHPYDGDVYVNERGWRYCRPCRREQNREYKARKRAALAGGR